MPEKEPKKIVLFGNMLRGAGGEERILWEEEKFFHNKGIETTILTFNLDKKALFDYQPQSLEVVEAGKSRLAQALALRRRLSQIKPDIIIGCSAADTMYLYVATRFLSMPYIAHIHGSLFWFPEETFKYSLVFRRVFSEIRDSLAGHKEFLPPKLNLSFKKRLASEVLAAINYLAVRKARQIIVLTEQVQWEVKKLYNRDSVVARGCLSHEVLNHVARQDIKLKPGMEGKKVILSIGRLDPRKRIDLLIRAFARIAAAHPDALLLIGGTGEESDRLKQLVRDLDVEKRVSFLGFIAEDELFDYYAGADVFAFPSWTSFGLTRYEALALCPKSVWSSEFAKEPFATDDHVFLADPTVEDFARSLSQALDAKVQGKANLRDFTWEHYFETVYRAAREGIKK